MNCFDKVDAEIEKCRECLKLKKAWVTRIADGIKADKERLRKALLALGVPVPKEGGTLAQWAEALECVASCAQVCGVEPDRILSMLNKEREHGKQSTNTD